MPLGIRPTVDFAFKMLFGNEKHADILIDLLNAALCPVDPIEEVEILNPIDEKPFLDDKLSIVDVKARDVSGAWYVIEVQTTIPAGLGNRLAYYTSGLYYGQLLEGKGYTSLRPAISICFLTRAMFPNVSNGHLHFSLFDAGTGVSFGDQVQIHLVELSKYNIREADLVSVAALEQWVYFMKSAAACEAEDLRRLLPSPMHQKATGVLEMITRSPDLRLVYDDRAKEERDKTAFHFDALEQGRVEGRAEGEAKGRLIGRIQILQQILSVSGMSDEELQKADLDTLKKHSDSLQSQLERRG